MKKVKPSLLRGFDQEYLPREQLQFNALVDLIRRNFELYSFLPIETPSAEALAKKVRAAMQEEISVEDRLNEEVRQILTQYADDMRRAGASYQEMYKKVKGELARQRKLILR